MDSSLRRRLVFENEDKSFWTWQNIRESFPELPITLDAHHHLINNHGESLEEAFEETRESWGKVLPVVHIAAGKRGLLDRDHHDWVEEIPSAFVSGKNLLADVEVEAGRRDMVVLYLKAKYGLWQA
jgi:UV DNA damage endonuclease